MPDRAWLGQLWLGWYVWREDPNRPFEPIRTRPEDAQQLQVRDIADERVWAALSEPDPHQPTWTHTGKIEEYEQRYREVERAALIVPAWHTPEGFVLIEGNHRACALYRLDPPYLDADVMSLSPPVDWPDVHPAPRRTTLSG
jgi:hypothetical protein